MPADLNVGIMYDLYQEKCHEEGRTSKKMSSYRQIFHPEFSISFHVSGRNVCVNVLSFCIFHRMKTKMDLWGRTRVIILKGKKWHRVFRMKKRKKQERWTYFQQNLIWKQFYAVQKQTSGLCYKRKFYVCYLAVMLNVGWIKWNVIRGMKLSEIHAQSKLHHVC